MNDKTRKDQRKIIAWVLTAIEESHGCTTGDCPHTNKEECIDAMLKQYRMEEEGITEQDIFETMPPRQGDMER